MVTASNRLLCIYHGDCADGFAAAAVVKMVYGSQVDFIAGVHGAEPHNTTDRDVLIIDFSYSRHQIIIMASKANSIHVIDHHHSALDELVNCPTNVKIDIDTEYCGAVLVWQHFYPKQKVPLLLQHIQDQDLLRFELPDTRAIMAAVFSLEYDLGIYKGLITNSIDHLIPEGEKILVSQVNSAKRLAKAAKPLFVAGHLVPAVNAPWFMSDQVCELIAGDEKFSVCYYIRGGMVEFSLRSNGDFDVSRIAKLLGGGGGKKSAGFRFPAADLPDLSATLV